MYDMYSEEETARQESRESDEVRSHRHVAVLKGDLIRYIDASQL